MKIVLLGKNGQLGWECQQIFGHNRACVALGARELDITEARQVEAMIERLQPEIIVNCAAFTNVDACERQRDLAYRVNVLGPRHLAAALQRRGGLLLHISTDYVFDGLRPLPEPYRETDPVSPLSYYGQTKAEAERVIMQEMDHYLIVRTAWLYGQRGRNFLKTMLRLALHPAKRPIRVVQDQFGSLTWSHRLARQLAELMAAGGRGIYHATAEGFASWFEVATYFFQQLGLEVDLEPCTSAEYPTPARRPRNSILENHRLKLQGLNLMRPWQSDLDLFLAAHRHFLFQEAKNSTDVR